MRFGRLIPRLTVCLLVLADPAMACDVGAAAATLNSIRRQLVDGEVKRIDLVKISDRLLASIPISPEHFATYSSERSSLTLTQRDAADLATAMTALSPAQSAYEPDLRWQLVLFDGAGNQLHTIFFSKRYLQGRGRTGYLDGNRCQFTAATIGTPAVVKWLQKRL